jgi:hypothetical protein
MSNKGKKHTKHKGRQSQPRPPATTQPPRLRSWLLDLPKKLWTWVIGVITLAGIVFFLPRLSVSPQEPLSPEDAFSTPFIFVNNGYLPLEITTIDCSIDQLTLAGNNKPNIAGAHSYSLREPIELGAGGQSLVPCLKAYHVTMPIESAEASMNLRIKPWPLFWSYPKRFRFTALHDSQGAVHWFPK